MAKPQPSYMDFDVSKVLNPTRLLADMKLTGLDFETVLSAQRRNLEALTAANQAALEGWQSMAKRQADVLRQSVEEATAAMRDLLAAGSPEEKAARQAELAKAAFGRAIANVREISEMLVRTQNEATDVIGRRVAEGLDEVKTLIAKRANGRAA